MLVPATVPAVWRSLSAYLTTHHRSVGSEAVGYVLGTEPRHAVGQPLGEGSALPGFAVAEVVPEQRVRLRGRHRFADYALTFTLATRPDGTLLSARSDAAFPGLQGRAYRRLVIGSGGHRLAVTRMLRRIGRRAESLDAG